MRASIVVPAYNESACVPLWTEELLPVLRELDADLVIVDDGSTDGTAEAAEQAGFRCVRIPHAGKTAALRAGVLAAACEVVVILDADLQESPAQISELLRALTPETALVTGYRVGRADGRWRKRIPSRIYRSLIGLLFGVSFRDINCGFRVARRETFLRTLRAEGDHRLVPLLVHQDGARVVEAPVRHRVRRAGVAKFDSPLRFLEGIRDLLRVKFGGKADGPTVEKRIPRQAS